TPGLVIQLQDRLLPGISLRGITSDDTSPAAEPRVALFQDGVPITQIASAYGEMFDVDRVEVEKGPQSTLHGRSALNGG
ncbi:TonB-dependent receptor plug domain-containing protein, partial [Caulobacter sp. CCH5-E12]